MAHRRDASERERFFAKWDSEIFLIARKITKNWANAEDLAQDVRVRLVDHPAYLALSDAQLRTLFWRTAVRLHIDGWRHQRIVARFRRFVQSEPNFDIESGEGAPAESDLDWEERLADAVSALPEQQRQTIVLRYYLEYSIEEIVGMLGIPQGAVHSNLHRAKNTLRSMLGHPGDEDSQA